MSNKKIKVEKELVPEPQEEEVTPAPAKPEPTPAKVVKEVAGVQIDVTPAQKVVPNRRYTFTQWAVRRGVKTRHQPGMRAFIKNPNKPRTIEEWDKLFVTY